MVENWGIKEYKEELQKMKQKLSVSNYIFIGSMLFGLFFGAGNLIFPIHLGQEAGRNVFIAIIGFILTATGLPFLGVLGIGLAGKENMFSLVKLVSKKWAYFFTILVYLTIGPFFAIPRTATVPYEIGITPMIPKGYNQVGLFIFTLMFFLVVLYISLNPGKLLVWIGKILNPLFLILIGILIIRAVFSPMGDISNINPQESYQSTAFFKGFTDGYNTMDAIASLAFGIIVVNTIKEFKVEKTKDIVLCIAKVGAICSFLMIVIYIGLSVIGAMSVGKFEISENGGIALAQIAKYYLGNLGNIVLAILITVACIKTAIGLICSTADIFVEMFPNSFSYKTYAIIFTVVSAIIANVGLTNIIKYSIPILLFLYPITIVTIFLSLFTKQFKDNSFIWKAGIFTACVFSIGDLLNALPEWIRDFFIVSNVLELYKKLPLFELGMAWLIPEIVVLVIVFCIVYLFPKFSRDKIH